jgi:hypothetical protein
MMQPGPLQLEGGIALRRKLEDGRLLEGAALEVYIPGRRGARHYGDCFSRALALGKQLPDYGQQLAWDHAPLLAELVPGGCDAIACPPASRRRIAGGFYFARELAAAVVAVLTDSRAVHLCRPLRWEVEEIAGAGAAKEIMHQGGQGRKLARRAECVEDLTGRQVCLVDDLFTTGITAARCAEALVRAGAATVYLVTLGATERTEKRPAAERDLLKLRRAAKGARRNRTG